MKQQGQVIIVLLLIILVSLSIGLAVVQNSLTDISTSSKTDQASRAFSAAEAGLESALFNEIPIPSSNPLSVGNSKVSVDINSDLPKIGQALEYPQITKADFAQFWLLTPTQITSLMNGSYTPAQPPDYLKPTFTVYFGTCNLNPSCESVADPPAIEVNVVTWDKSSKIFSNLRQFYDSDSSRANANKFYNATRCSSSAVTAITSSYPSASNPSKFYCQTDVTGYASPSSIPVLVRIRLLYSASQKVAVGPSLLSDSLPAQASTYKSTGIAGDSTREIKVFREKKVVPYFFDYAIFSNNSINK